MRSTTGQDHAAPRAAARYVDFRQWTIEELRALGVQLRLPDAQRKTRSELLEILDVRLPERRDVQSMESAKRAAQRPRLD